VTVDVRLAPGPYWNRFDTGPGWITRRVSSCEYRPWTYACQSLLIWYLPLPKKFHSLSLGIMLIPCTADGSKKQLVPRMSSLAKMLGEHSADGLADVFTRIGTPPALLTAPMPPVVMRPGNVLLDTPIRPMSGRYDELEKLRSAWSSGFCSL
jgi:hypothetical protein